MEISASLWGISGLVNFLIMFFRPIAKNVKMHYNKPSMFGWWKSQRTLKPKGVPI